MTSRKGYGRIFLERLAIVLVLVMVTYNITGYSYYHWAFETPFAGLGNPAGVVKVVVGILLAVCYLALFYAAWRAKGPVGLLITVGVCTAIVWLLQTMGWIDISNPTTSILVVQILLIFIISLGSTWSIFWRRITGQIAVEDPDTVAEADA